MLREVQGHPSWWLRRELTPRSILNSRDVGAVVDEDGDDCMGEPCLGRSAKLRFDGP